MARKNNMSVVYSLEAHEALKKTIEDKADACLDAVKVMLGKSSLEKISSGTLEILASLLMNFYGDNIKIFTELLFAIKETEDEDLPLLMNSENEYIKIYVSERIKSEKFNTESDASSI